jgi:hypothetical protein
MIIVQKEKIKIYFLFLQKYNNINSFQATWQNGIQWAKTDMRWWS